MSETTDLRHRLDQLAERGLHDAVPAQPDEAWARGRAWQRRRGVTAAVAGAAALVVLVVGIGAHQLASPDLAPAPAGSTEGAPRLPDRLYDAPGWLPSTADEAPGVLSAVVGGYRNALWGEGEPALVGVSSETGEYRFLDLPGRATGVEDPQTESVALSPDGRRIAYWVEGEPEKPSLRVTDPVVVGVAVQDMASGDVVRHEWPTDHGLIVDEMLWAGDTLWLSHSQRTGAGATSGTDGLTASWTLGDPEPQTWERGRSPQLFDATGSDGVLVSVVGRRVTLTRPDEQQVLTLDARAEGWGALSPAGEQLALTLDPDGPGFTDSGPRLLAVADLTQDDATTTRRVGDVEAYQVVGWRDEEHVVALVPVEGGSSVAWSSIDVVTGRSTPLVTPGSPHTIAADVEVAQDAWAGDVFAAPEPPSPLDPRLRWSLLVGVPLVALLGLLTWRRRAQP